MSVWCSSTVPVTCPSGVLSDHARSIPSGLCDASACVVMLAIVGVWHVLMVFPSIYVFLYGFFVCLLSTLVMSMHVFYRSDAFCCFSHVFPYFYSVFSDVMMDNISCVD